MSSERTRPLSGHVHRLAYRWFSWTVTGLTVALFLLLVVSAILSGPTAGTADASMVWSAYQIARGLAFSLVVYLVMPFVPVVIVFWALSDGSPSDDEGSLASIPLSVRVLLLVAFAALGRLQESVSIAGAVNAVQASQIVVALVGFCIAVVVILLVAHRFLGGRDDSEEADCSESVEPRSQPISDGEAR